MGSVAAVACHFVPFAFLRCRSISSSRDVVFLSSGPFPIGDAQYRSDTELVGSGIVAVVKAPRTMKQARQRIQICADFLGHYRVFAGTVYFQTSRDFPEFWVPGLAVQFIDLPNFVP